MLLRAVIPNVSVCHGSLFGHDCLWRCFHGQDYASTHTATCLLNIHRSKSDDYQLGRVVFFIFRDLAAGLRAPTGVTRAAGSRKNCAQPGLNCARFSIMHAVTRSTSGMTALQSRKASPLQSCC